MVSQDDEKTDLVQDGRKDNRTQFIQNRILAKMESAKTTQDVADVTCLSCDELMRIISNNEQSILSECPICGIRVVVGFTKF